MRTLALAASLVAVLALSAPAASAAGQATNGRTLTLRYPPQPGDAACATRLITLAQGSYSWRLGETSHGLADWALPHTQTGIVWREYTWTDCIGYAVRDGRAVYRHDSYLTWPGGHFTAPSHYARSRASGRYSVWFGSTLVRN